MRGWPLLRSAAHAKLTAPLRPAGACVGSAHLFLAWSGRRARRFPSAELVRVLVDEAREAVR